jgi:hypothetical protein
MAIGQKTGGRAKGTPNKATADIRALAQEYTAEALEGLVTLMRSAQSEQAKVAAIKELLDRGHGRSMLPVQQVEDPWAKLTDTDLTRLIAWAEAHEAEHGPHAPLPADVPTH